MRANFRFLLYYINVYFIYVIKYYYNDYYYIIRTYRLIHQQSGLVMPPIYMHLCQ